MISSPPGGCKVRRAATTTVAATTPWTIAAHGEYTTVPYKHMSKSIYIPVMTRAQSKRYRAYISVTIYRWTYPIIKKGVVIKGVSMGGVYIYS